MQFQEEAIVLSARKFGESGLIVEFFAQTQGFYSGLVRGGQSKSKLPIFQPGNVIDATWRARLDEQLGVLTAELMSPIAAKLIHDQFRLQALLSICSILRRTLAERNSYTHLYNFLMEYMERLTTAQNFMEDYVWFEIGVLKYLGFGLDISECAVTGQKKGLCYLSPKTGRAVTKIGANGYEDKLLKLPGFIAGESFADNAQVIEGLVLTEHFLSKNLFAPYNRNLPDERIRLREMLMRSNQRLMAV